MHHDGQPDFAGLKITQDWQLAERRPEWRLRVVRSVPGVHRILADAAGEIGWAGNSGFHAVNLAVQFGVRKIALVGFDMRVDLGLHWHGEHRHGLNNPAAAKVARWRRILDAAADTLAALGVAVVNCSDVSALTAYPKTSLEEALAC